MTSIFQMEAYTNGLLDPGWGGFIHQDFPRTIVEGFYTNSEILAEQVNARIQGRTPIRTGALVSSETYIINHDPSNEDLVTFFARPDEQLAVWNRVYVMYQEGPPLGLSTYTNDPHQMYTSVLTEDINLIEAWGYETLDHQAGVISATIGYKS